MDKEKETIASIATGSSAGGLGVIRISGPRALNIMQKVFLPKKTKNLDYKPRYMYYGSFVVVSNTEKISQIIADDFHLAQSFQDNSSDFFIIDEILAVYFPGPNSYTGEDVVEIHAHGGNALLHNLLEYIFSLNIRQAEAGEFTKRAFLNGRIDLSQAEAVAEIISAPALEGVKLASAKLQGLLGKKIEELREQLEYLRRRLCLAIDFPEEEGECLPHNEFQSLVQNIIDEITKLILAYERNKPWQDGCLVVLAGQVNAGKSSLMNAFLGRKRAIVTPEAGTTRDYLEETCYFSGLPIKLTDTAGLREISYVLTYTDHSEFELNNLSQKRLFHALDNNEQYNYKSDAISTISPIELEGIRRSLEKIEQADLILMVFDGAILLDETKNSIDENKLDLIAKKIKNELALLPLNTKKICIWNKADLALLTEQEKNELEKLLETVIFYISANPCKDKESLNNLQSIDDLANYARQLLLKHEMVNDEITPNLRQVRLLKSALQELTILFTEIEILPPDINAIRLESAAQYLSSITGLSSVDETFNTIFQEFCIGK